MILKPCQAIELFKGLGVEVSREGEGVSRIRNSSNVLVPVLLFCVLVVIRVFASFIQVFAELCCGEDCILCF